MGIRDWMNSHARLTASIVLGVILVVILAAVLQGRGRNVSEGTALAERKSWYTTDDGKTWFPDAATKIPPFKKDGKDAVRAHVYRAPDGTEFVGFLERYTPAGKAAMEAELSRPPDQASGVDPTMAAGSDATEIKKPGQANWVKISDPAADNVYRVVSPKGQSEGLTLVEAK
jgi:hypothetical protein